MNRSAIFRDIPAIEAMLAEMYARSKYAGRVNIVPKATRALLELAVAAQNQHGPQASLVRISEENGKPCGFILGTLARIYNIGDKLVAQDLFLYVRPGSRTTHVIRLIDDYIAWARGNRQVIEVNLSWTDTLPGAERIATLYRAKGFSLVGEMYEMRLDAVEEAAA